MISRYKTKSITGKAMVRHHMLMPVMSVAAIYQAS